MSDEISIFLFRFRTWFHDLYMFFKKGKRKKRPLCLVYVLRTWCFRTYEVTFGRSSYAPLTSFTALEIKFGVGVGIGIGDGDGQLSDTP